MRGCRRLALVGLVVMTGWMFSAAVEAEVPIGEQAPDFTLPDAQGAERSLSEFKGSHVVLEWFNHDCPFVKKHYGSGNMQQLQRTYADQGVVWLSINSSAPGKQGHLTPEDAIRLTEEKGASPTAVLLDPDGEVGRRYGAKTTPHMFIINPEGVLIYAGAIDDAPSTNQADIPKATNYVQVAMAEALAGQAVSIPSTESYGCSVKYAEGSGGGWFKKLF